jgi:predicted  nucleic acid-binding Zn-ribbon protein
MSTPRVYVLFLVLLLMPLSCRLPAEESRLQAGWSSVLLKEVLDAGNPARRVTGQSAGEGFVLRTYQLHHLRLGDPGRSRSALQLLQRLLPEGSSLRQDLPANSLHLLSSVTAHEAVWDFLSTVDVPSEATSVVAKDLSPELRKALEQLEELRAGNGRVSSQLENLRGELGTIAAGGQARSSQIILYVAIGVVVVVIASLLLGWRLRRELRTVSLAVREAPAEYPPQALQGLVQGSLVPVQRELQQEMMGVLNAAAIRMEAWYNEQRTRGEALELEARRQREDLALAQTALTGVREQLRSDHEELAERLGARIDASTGRLDENVRALGDQHQRVERLALELQTTVRELDQAKDQVLVLQRELEERRGDLDGTRERLSARESELVRQQAKLAALTLILEEGSLAVATVPDPVVADVGAKVEIQPVLVQELNGNEEGLPSELENPCKTTNEPIYTFLPPGPRLS